MDPDKVRRLSLSEQQLENAVETYGKDIIRYAEKVIINVKFLFAYPYQFGLVCLHVLQYHCANIM